MDQQQAAMAAAKPTFKVSQESLRDVLDQLKMEEIVVASHQREYCWSLERQQELVDTVVVGLPIPVVILFRRADRTVTLEDGHQRLKTLLRFRENEFPTADGRMYRDLSVEDRLEFDRYQVPILTYRNATPQQMVEIFNRFQNGSPLTVGERLHSLESISPLVRIAKRLLLTVGEGLHDRASATWGSRAGDDSRRRRLTVACALVAGLAFDTASLSRKWKDFERKNEAGVMTIAREIDEPMVIRKLESILRIYEHADAELRVGGKGKQEKLWNPGTFTGYIVYSLNSSEEAKWPALEARWTAFIVETRRNPEAMTQLTDTIEKARLWTVARWQTGCNAVMPDLFGRISEDESEEEDTEEEDA